MLLCILPAYIYIYQLKRESLSINIPFLPIVGGLYAYYFALPGLLGEYFEVGQVVLDKNVLNDASFLSCVGWSLLLIGFYSTRKYIQAFVKPLYLPIDGNKAESTGWFLIGVGVAATSLHSQFMLPSSLIQVVRFLSLCLELGIGLLLILALRKQLSSKSRPLFWYLLIPLFLLLQLSIGLTSSLIIAGSYIFMVVWGVRKKVSLWLIIILILSAGMVRGVMDEFRLLTWSQGQYEHVSAFDKSMLMLSLVGKSMFEFNGGSDNFSDTVDFLIYKRSMFSTFAYVIGETPDYIPFWGGETYLSLPATIIPRFLWPDKPTKDLGPRYGHRYSLLGEYNFNTSMNLPQMIEFYVNFGVLGVLIGMFLLGLIYQILYQKINLKESGDGVLLIGAIVFSRMLNVESDFSLIFGQVMQTVFIYYILFKVLKKI